MLCNISWIKHNTHCYYRYLFYYFILLNTWFKFALKTCHDPHFYVLTLHFGNLWTVQGLLHHSLRTQCLRQCLWYWFGPGHWEVMLCCSACHLPLLMEPKMGANIIQLNGSMTSLFSVFRPSVDLTMAAVLLRTSLWSQAASLWIEWISPYLHTT